MITAIYLDTNTDTRYIQTVEQANAYAFAFGAELRALMCATFGLPTSADNATLAAAMSAATGKTFVADDTVNVVPPDRMTERYTFAARDGQLEISKTLNQANIELFEENVLSPSDWGLIVALMTGTPENPLGSEAAALQGIATALGVTTDAETIYSDLTFYCEVASASPLDAATWQAIYDASAQHTVIAYLNSEAISQANQVNYTPKPSGRKAVLSFVMLAKDRNAMGATARQALAVDVITDSVTQYSQFFTGIVQQVAAEAPEALKTVMQGVTISVRAMGDYGHANVAREFAAWLNAQDRGEWYG